MDCERAKQLLRDGNAADAAAHIELCADCAAFAEVFAEDAEMFSLAMAVAPPAEESRTRAFEAAALEIEHRLAVRRVPTRAPRMRTAAAAVFAALSAPALLIVNYLFAHAAYVWLSGWLSPVVGNVFFVAYAIEVVAVIGLAYGALPIIIAAAGNSLKQNSPNGGFAT